jgi:hypothetical protein
MPYSEVVDGKVLDYHFKPLKINEGYNFCIGDIHVGQVFRLGRNKWAAVTNYAHPLFPVYGLATRLDAAELLLKVRRLSEK